MHEARSVVSRCGVVSVVEAADNVMVDYVGRDLHVTCSRHSTTNLLQTTAVLQTCQHSMNSLQQTTHVNVDVSQNKDHVM